MCEQVYAERVTKQFSSVWTREPRPAKTPGLNREQIVSAAIELLDAEGLEQLSMRKLGAKLSAGATSLYWHVANKDELLELVYDEVWGEVKIPTDPDVAWREALTSFAYSVRHMILRHGWLTGLIGRVPGLGPRAIRIGNDLLTTLAKEGFSINQLNYGSAAVMSYVLGSTIPEVTWAATVEGRELDTETILRTVRQAAADYPDLLAFYEETQARDPQTMRALGFDFGLLCVLDGLEVRLHKEQDPTHEGLSRRP